MLEEVTGKKTVDYGAQDVAAGVDNFANILFVATVEFEERSHRHDTVSGSASD